jgi:hypothetical protein
MGENYCTTELGKAANGAFAAGNNKLAKEGLKEVIEDVRTLNSTHRY